MAKRDISQRRACELVSVDPKTVRCERAPDNPEIRVRMRAIANERRPFGYRRVGVILQECLPGLPSSSRQHADATRDARLRRKRPV
jgi:hypothetical protein